MLTFRFGTMNCGKSTDLIFRERIATKSGAKTLIVKPTFDTRDGSYSGYGPFKSRCVKSEKQALYVQSINTKELLATGADTIFIDEVQFFTPKDVDALVELSDKHNLTVSCYGLKTDVRGLLFDTAEKLLAVADYATTVGQKDCDICGRKPASHHLRYIEGVLDRGGASKVAESDFVSYKAVCRNCWNQNQRS